LVAAPAQLSDGFAIITISIFHRFCESDRFVLRMSLPQFLSFCRRPSITAVYFGSDFVQVPFLDAEGCFAFFMELVQIANRYSWAWPYYFLKFETSLRIFFEFFQETVR
jgi:hypothetical protein